MLQDFKAFVMRGNVLDMAVGIVIGGAFGKIVSSFVKDVIMPPIGKLMGGVDFSSLYINLSGGSFASLAEGDPAAEVPVRDGFLLFAGGALRAPVRLASLLFVNRAYSADEVAALGKPGPQGIPAP